MKIIYLFLFGFLLGLIYAVVGSILPTKIEGIEEKENSWILNLFIGVLNGLLLTVSYYFFDFSFEFLTSIVVGALLFTIFISDFKYMIILDSPLIVCEIAILVIRFCYYGIKNVGMSLLSGLILFLFMLLIGFLGKKVFKREALGGGDIKLAFVIGTILNLRLGFMAIIISSLLAMPYALASMLLGNNREVPYGPFLVGGLGLVFLFSDKFLNLLNFFG